MILAAGAVGVILGQQWGVYATPVFVLLMIAIGTDSAWDLLLGDFGKRSFIDI